MVRRKKVISIEIRKGKKGKYAMMVVAEGKTTREEHVFGPGVKNMTIPGLYDFTYMQNSFGFWVIDKVNLVQKA